MLSLLQNRQETRPGLSKKAFKRRQTSRGETGMTAVCASKQAVLTIMTWAVGIGVSLAAAQAAEFEAIKAAAAKEGKVVVWHNTPNQKTTDALAALFNARLGMNIKVERVSVSGSDIT